MPEKRIVRVAAVQIAPDLDTPTGTLDRVLAALDEAALYVARADDPESARSEMMTALGHLVGRLAQR